MEEFNYLSALLGAFGLGLLKLLFDVIKWYFSRKDKEKLAETQYKKQQVIIEELFQNLFASAVQIQDIIDELCKTVNAATIRISKLQNGGGIPQLGAQQYLSVLYETINTTLTPDNLESIKHDIQNYSVDTASQSIIKEMLEHEIIVKPTDELSHGMLWSISKKNNIYKSVFMPVVHVPSLDDSPAKGFLIYITIQYSKQVEIDDRMLAEMNIAVEKIKNIFNVFYIKQLAKLKIK